MKLDLSMGSVLFLIGFIFLYEKLRLCQAEFINTLLNVAHHKYVGRPEPLSGNTADQRLLYLIAVLIFIHQNLLIEPGQLVGRRPRSMIRAAACKDLQGKMLQVVKIHQIFLFLRRLEPVGKFLGQTDQNHNRAVRLRHVGKNILGIRKKVKGFYLLNSILDLVPKRRRQLLFLRIDLLFSCRRQTSKHGLCKNPAKLAVGFGLHQAFHHPKILRQHRKISLGPVLLLGDLNGAQKLLFKALRLQMNVMDQKPHPFRLFKVLLFPAGSGLQLFFAGRKPLVGPGIALGESPDLQDIVLQAAVCFPRRVAVREPQELRIRFLIAVLQKGL